MRVFDDFSGLSDVALDNLDVKRSVIISVHIWQCR